MARLPGVLSCGESTGAHRGRTTLHSHPGCELIAVLAGTAAVRAGGRRFRLAPGTVLRLPAGCRHDQEDLAPLRQRYAVLDLADLPGPERPEALRLPPGEPALGWLGDLVRLAQAVRRDPAVEAGLIAALMARLDRLAGREPAPAHAGLPAPLAALVRLTEARPLDALDAGRLAARAGVSASHLRALCRQHLGVAPGELRRLARLRLAQRLLRQGRLGIAAVAAASGWRDQNYFARYFRSRTGMSPRAFRTAYRGSADRG